MPSVPTMPTSILRVSPASANKEMYPSSGKCTWVCWAPGVPQHVLKRHGNSGTCHLDLAQVGLREAGE